MFPVTVAEMTLKTKKPTKLSLSTMACGIPHGVAQQVLKNACAKYVCVVIH